MTIASDDDFDLFRQAMSDVDHLKHDKISPERNRTQPLPTRHTKQLISSPLGDLSTPVDLIGSEQSLRFRRSGIQERQLQKLQSGQISMQAELDLHGMTIAVAYQAVSAFIVDCQSYQIRAARIIHGKGWSSSHHKPILKTKLDQWLRQLDAVLAFCSARIEDGGTGAVYVLLRKKMTQPSLD